MTNSPATATTLNELAGRTNLRFEPFPPVDCKPGLYYEVRRRREALPGVSHDCPMSLPCVSPVNFIGLAYATEAPAVCPNLGRFSPAQPEMPSSTSPCSLRPRFLTPLLFACRFPPSGFRFQPFSVSASCFVPRCRNPARLGREAWCWAFRSRIPPAASRATFGGSAAGGMWFRPGAERIGGKPEVGAFSLVIGLPYG